MASAPRLDAYESVVGSSTLEELHWLARRLVGRRILLVNSTRVGGGVAEILNRIVPLLEDLGLSVTWDVLEGSEPFFKVTKTFHNALQGAPERITRQMCETFLSVARKNAERLPLDQDLIFVHDPQPLALVERRSVRPTARWVWRKMGATPR